MSPYPWGYVQVLLLLLIKAKAEIYLDIVKRSFYTNKYIKNMSDEHIDYQN